ncbi:MFS transporter [Propionivibrio sp.]|uniref:MFS transporter n=1 Tax=Propionivibrio sp. TaxID=2212460 RepID=UPI0025E596A1|nr:MFS transporter [Propionivibrio sp.]MBK7355868.1 MFS transporter [Propionivibrio sp.]MBK8400468.1 MFS transporter [Propionivibrio sp.]MBK8895275.1 MFS transporter [Propionivibrio sp.]MBL0206828.1 MFS transporter [Propionivibrio sp.]
MHRIPYWRLSGFYFFYFAFIGVFLPYFGLYLQSLSFSALDISILMSQMQLMRLFGPYLWGALADRIGKRVPIVRLACLMALLVSTSFFLIRSFEAFLVAMAVLAFFWSASLPLVETLTFEHLREGPERYSRIRIWGSIGFIATVMGAGALLDLLEITSLLWMIVIPLVGTMAYAMAMPEAEPGLHPADHPPVWDILRQRRVLALFSACFSMSAAHGALYVFFSIFLSDHGYSKSAVGGLWSLGVLAEIAVFFYMSRLQRVYSLRTILLLSFSAAVLRFLMIGMGVELPVIIVLAQLLHGLTFGSFHAAAITAVNRWFPGRTRSRGQALYSSLTFGAGGLVGGLISGWTWDHLGGALTFALSSFFALVGLVLVTIWIPEKDVVMHRASAAI